MLHTCVCTWHVLTMYYKYICTYLHTQLLTMVIPMCSSNQLIVISPCNQLVHSLMLVLYYFNLCTVFIQTEAQAFISYK